jgi:cobalamin biosynthesis Co2+ chelatase CbiK
VEGILVGQELEKLWREVNALKKQLTDLKAGQTATRE